MKNMPDFLIRFIESDAIYIFFGIALLIIAVLIGYVVYLDYKTREISKYFQNDEMKNNMPSQQKR